MEEAIFLAWNKQMLKSVCFIFCVDAVANDFLRIC